MIVDNLPGNQTGNSSLSSQSISQVYEEQTKTFWQLEFSIFGEDDTSWYLDYVITIFTIANIFKPK